MKGCHRAELTVVGLQSALGLGGKDSRVPGELHISWEVMLASVPRDREGFAERGSVQIDPDAPAHILTAKQAPSHLHVLMLSLFNIPSNNANPNASPTPNPNPNPIFCGFLVPGKSQSSVKNPEVLESQSNTPDNLWCWRS